MGYDSGGSHYGNKAFIYVNKSGVFSGLNDSIFRSIFVNGSLDNDVEVGWTAHNGGHSGPTVYAEWLNRGVDSGPQFYTGYSLSYDTNYRFFVENVGHIEIFRFIVDGQSSPFNYSPTMNFNTGGMLTNSERYNSCDSLWTHEYSLGYMVSDGSWSSSYDNLACWGNTTTAWYLNKNSNSDLNVTQSSSGSIC